MVRDLNRFVLVTNRVFFYCFDYDFIVHLVSAFPVFFSLLYFAYRKLYDFKTTCLGPCIHGADHGNLIGSCTRSPSVLVVLCALGRDCIQTTSTLRCHIEALKKGTMQLDQPTMIALPIRSVLKRPDV